MYLLVVLFGYFDIMSNRIWYWEYCIDIFIFFRERNMKNRFWDEMGNWGHRSPRVNLKKLLSGGSSGFIDLFNIIGFKRRKIEDEFIFFIDWLFHIFYFHLLLVLILIHFESLFTFFWYIVLIFFCICVFLRKTLMHYFRIRITISLRLNIIQ